MNKQTKALAAALMTVLLSGVFSSAETRAQSGVYASNRVAQVEVVQNDEALASIIEEKLMTADFEGALQIVDAMLLKDPTNSVALYYRSVVRLRALQDEDLDLGLDDLDPDFRYMTISSSVDNSNVAD